MAAGFQGRPRPDQDGTRGGERVGGGGGCVRACVGHVSRAGRWGARTCVLAQPKVRASLGAAQSAVRAACAGALRPSRGGPPLAAPPSGRRV